MKLHNKKIKTGGYRLSVASSGIEIGRAYFYFLKNDLHKRPFVFVEDVHVDEKFRGKGVGSTILREIKKISEKNNCYKIILNSRLKNNKVHKFYERLGFIKHGYEFRINF